MFNIKMNISYLYFILTLLFSVFAPIRTACANDDLTLGVHPYLSETELIKIFTPFANYLTKHTGRTVKIKIGSSYEEHIQYLGLNKIDIAYLGPASYVAVSRDFGDKPLLARLEVDGKPWFQGNIIVRDASGIKTLDDLKGKRIAFGDPNSTMSYIVPHYMLHKAGVYDGSTTRHQFLYSHTNVALGVLSGDFDAGAVKPAVFKKFESQGLRTIAQTPRISEHLFATRSDLPAEQIGILRNILLNMKKSAEGLAALHAINDSITGLVAVSSSNYDNLRKIIDESQEFQ